MFLLLRTVVAVPFVAPMVSCPALFCPVLACRMDNLTRLLSVRMRPVLSRFCPPMPCCAAALNFIMLDSATCFVSPSSRVLPLPFCCATGAQGEAERKARRRKAQLDPPNDDRPEGSRGTTVKSVRHGYPRTRRLLSGKHIYAERSDGEGRRGGPSSQANPFHAVPAGKQAKVAVPRSLSGEAGELFEAGGLFVTSSLRDPSCAVLVLAPPDVRRRTSTCFLKPDQCDGWLHPATR